MPPPIAELFGHRWSPRSILRLAHDIYGRVPHARLYTVGVEQIDEEATLSGVVRASVDRLVERWLRRFALPPSFPVDDRPRPFENSSTS